MLHAITRSLVLSTLEGTPAVFDGLIAGINDDSPIWDRRPDEDRFTLREVMAHLADMELVWNERLQRMLRENNPLLPDVDETQLTLDHLYARSVPRDRLAQYRQERAALMKTLRSLSEQEWARTGTVRGIIPMTIEVLAVHIAGHDGYHTTQVAHWVNNSQ